MDAILMVILIFGAAFAWMGLTAFVLLRLRRRRTGSSLIASAVPPPDRHGNQRRYPRRSVRPVTPAPRSDDAD